MFSMGIGSYLSKLFVKDLITTFIYIEIIISLIGGVCSILLFIVFPHAFGLYTTVMYMLILVIGTLVGLEIPILTRILSEYKEMRVSLAHVLSVDYVGALIGSLIFPLILLPQLGLVRSSFAIGLLNISVALINIYVFRKNWDKIKYAKVVSFSILILVLMVTAIFMGSWLTRFAEHQLYFDQVIYKKQTPYQRVVFTKNQMKQEHRLYIDGHIQFAESDEYRYHESLVHPLLALPGKRTNVLILGGGDGMAAREIFKWKDVEKIDLVDIDPDITKVCSELARIVILNKGSLKDERLTVFNEDAFTFLNQSGIKYDRIIIDLPDPHNETLSKLYSREFYHIIMKRMHEDGAMICQSSSPFFTRDVFWCIAESMENVGLKTRSFHTTIPSFGIWGFHLASRTEVPDLGGLDVSVPTRYLNQSILNSSQIFGKDISRTDVPVNSMLEPKIYQLYNDALRKMDLAPETANSGK